MNPFVFLWGSICPPQGLHRKCLPINISLIEVHCIYKKECSVGTGVLGTISARYSLALRGYRGVAWGSGAIGEKAEKPRWVMLCCPIFHSTIVHPVFIISCMKTRQQVSSWRLLKANLPRSSGSLPASNTKRQTVQISGAFSA